MEKKYMVRIGTNEEVFVDSRSERRFDSLEDAWYYAVKWCEDDRQQNLLFEVVELINGECGNVLRSIEFTGRGFEMYSEEV